MDLQIDEKDLKKFIIIGDRVLVKPRSNQKKTKSGLYLPPTVSENEKLHSGYVVKVGPGYPIPAINEADEPWKTGEKVRYVPLQPLEGDLAIYFHKLQYYCLSGMKGFLSRSLKQKQSIK
jgi:chaperonin GroES